MTISTFNDFSTTASSNIDVNGISIQGTAAVQNFDNSFRELMAILRRDLDNGMVFTSKSADYTAVANDNNGFIRFSAAATLGLTTAATLGAGWHCWVMADGANVVINPFSTETINGASTITVPDGFSTLVVCDGTNFRATEEYSILSRENTWSAIQTFTSAPVMSGSGQNLILRSQNSGAGIAYLRFQDSAQTALGYVGLDSASTTNLAVKRNTAGNIDIDATSTGTVTVTGATTFNQNIVVGTYSGTGATVGKDIALSTIANLRSSTTLTTSATHQQFINGNGAVGSISTNGTSTSFTTTSDERLKDFIGEYDPLKAIEIIRADPVRDFVWKCSGKYAVGWGAQSSFAVSDDLATEGEGEPGDDDFIPWGVDQSKRTPYLWAAMTWALDKIEDLEHRLAALENANG